MAVSAAELVVHPEVLAKARAEFEAKIKETPYVNPIPDGIEPPPVSKAGHP